MPRPLNILFIVHNQTQKGGAYYRGLNLAAPLMRRGHTVTLMTIHPSNRWQMVDRSVDGVRVVESPDLFWGIGRTGWDPWDTFKRTLWIRRHRFDVIHTVDTRPAVSLPALLGRKACGAMWIADASPGSLPELTIPPYRHHPSRLPIRSDFLRISCGQAVQNSSVGHSPNLAPSCGERLLAELNSPGLFGTFSITPRYRLNFLYPTIINCGANLSSFSWASDFPRNILE